MITFHKYLLAYLVLLTEKEVIIINNISLYGICGVLGFILGIVYLFLICKKRKVDFNDYIYVYTWAAIGTMIGAKLLYIFLELKNIFHYFSRYDKFDYIYSLLSGGFVFYGGLIGAIISISLSCKYFHLDKNEVFTIITPAMPLAHAFGRIGCTIVGCCYGVEINDGIGIVYQHSLYAPLGVKLFPVQLTEAFGDIVIFFFLLYLVYRDRFKNRILIIYLLLYSIMRFSLEFFRGDLDRGGWWIFSTSQWISIGILLFVARFELRRLYFNNK